MDTHDSDDQLPLPDQDQMARALLRNGDMIQVGESPSGPLFEPTAKGVTKGIMQQIARVTFLADEHMRNYTPEEKRELLAHVETLHQALTRNKSFAELHRHRDSEGLALFRYPRHRQSRSDAIRWMACIWLLFATILAWWKLRQRKER